MSNNKRFSKEEIDALSKSPYVKNIREDRLTFTYEFRCIVYDRWIVNPGLSELRKILESFGFSRSLLGSTFSKKMHYRFIGNGRPSGGKNKIFKVNAQNIDKYDDSFLIDSDVFIDLLLNLLIKSIKNILKFPSNLSWNLMAWILKELVIKESTS